MKTQMKTLIVVGALGLATVTGAFAQQDGAPSNEQDRSGATTDSSMTSAYPVRPAMQQLFNKNGRDAYAQGRVGGGDGHWTPNGMMR